MHRLTRFHPNLVLSIEDSKKPPKKTTARSKIPINQIQLEPSQFEEYVEVQLANRIELGLYKPLDQWIEGVSEPSHLNPEIDQEEQGFRPISFHMDLESIPPKNPISINPLVQLKGLPIVILVGLQVPPMPSNMPTFKGIRDDNPSAHVKRFLE